MPRFTELLHIVRPWADWIFLEQQRDVEGGGGFHVHNPWGNSNQAQGSADRNRVEIAYRTAAGADLWGQVVLHGPTGNVGLGTVNPRARLHVNGDMVVTGDVQFDGNYLYTRSGAVVTCPPHTSNTSLGFTYDNIVVEGSLQVRGPLSASQITSPNKQFLIPHPLAPEEKNLVHACIEGPESAVFYRGEGRLTAGRAEVRLPDYFESLTRQEGRTVLVTPKLNANDGFSPLAVSAVQDGCFSVVAGDSTHLNQEFFWEVKAVRSDLQPLSVECAQANQG